MCSSNTIHRPSPFNGDDLPSCRYCCKRVVLDVDFVRLDVSLKARVMDWLVLEEVEDRNSGVVDVKFAKQSADRRCQEFKPQA